MAMVITLSCVVFAQDIAVVFNAIRINIGGVGRVEQNEKYFLDNGEQVPDSIVYKDTTYIPIRKISELLGQEVLWNGDTQTASVVSKGTGSNPVTKPDALGNMWDYSVFHTTEGALLRVKDQARGFGRVYKIETSQLAAAVHANDLPVTYTDEAVFFVKTTGAETNDTKSEVWKINFNSDISGQDGESMRTLPVVVHEVIFDGGFLYLPTPCLRPAAG